MHGGKSLAGIASPTFKTGRYSKHLPARLAERYQHAANDPELLALREDVALVDARLEDLLSRVDTGEAGVLWREARKAYHELREANATHDVKKASEAFASLGQWLEKGAGDYAAWDEINRVLEQRRRLVESERKRLIEMEQVITSEQAMVLIAALTESVRRHVTDRPTLAAIQTDFVRLVNRANVGSLADGRTDREPPG
jgi:hypothetical protein